MTLSYFFYHFHMSIFAFVAINMTSQSNSKGATQKGTKQIWKNINNNLMTFKIQGLSWSVKTLIFFAIFFSCYFFSPFNIIWDSIFSKNCVLWFVMFILWIFMANCIKLYNIGMESATLVNNLYHWVRLCDKKIEKTTNNLIKILNLI